MEVGGKDRRLSPPLRSSFRRGALGTGGVFVNAFQDPKSQHKGLLAFGG